MLQNQWYVILESKEVKRKEVVGIERLGKRLVLWRTENGKLNCTDSVCAHRGADLGLGKSVGDRIRCPFHGLEFNGSGRCVLIPANGRISAVPKNFTVKSYQIEEVNGFVFLWNGDEAEDLPPVRYFEDVDDSFSYSTFVDHWPVHYSRAIENQLDAPHVPFVHRTMIGKGNRTVIHGPAVKLENDVLRFWTDSAVDDGKTVPLKPEEMDLSGKKMYLEFIFPNVWQNRIDDKLRVVAAFVPVNDENTLMYLRFYHKFTAIPLIRDLVSFFGIIFSKKVLRQDKAVVLSQEPKRTDLGVNENLFQGDLPVVVYRRHYRELMGEREIKSVSSEEA